MRVLVCGSRDFIDTEFLTDELNKLHSVNPFTYVIEGEAKGADTLARQWAQYNQISILRFPADWNRYGKGAGPVRNKQMLVEGKPDLVVAFSYDIKNSKGTANMMKQAQLANVPVLFRGK